MLYFVKHKELLSRERKEVHVFCKCFTGAVSGTEAFLVSVEADVRNGLPGFQMVGNLSGDAKEAKDRVRIAIENSGYILPPKKITVNLAPAEIKKEGTSFDLPVAVAILAAFGYVPENTLNEYLIAGELSLDGKIEKTKKLLPLIFVAKEKGLKVICSKENLNDINWTDDVPVCGAETLEELVDIILDERTGPTRFSPKSDLILLKEDASANPFSAGSGKYPYRWERPRRHGTPGFSP